MRIIDLTQVADDGITPEQMLALEDPSQTLKITVSQLTAYVNKAAETVFVKKAGDAMTGKLDINTAANTDVALALGGLLKISGVGYTTKDGVFEDPGYRNVSGDMLKISETAKSRTYLIEPISGGVSQYADHIIGVTGPDGMERYLKIRSTGEIFVDIAVHAGSAKMMSNGDLLGDIWGGWLSNWLNSSVVHDIALGALGSQPTHDAWETSIAPYGCVQVGIHSNYNDSNWEVDSLYYKPIKKFVSNAWWGIGEVARVAVAEDYPAVAIPESGIDELRHLSPFRHKQTPPGCVDFIDDNGYLWSDAQKALIGNVFITYDTQGIICGISEKAWMLHIDNVSVAGLDNLPEGCSVDGSWIFNGEQIYQKTILRTPRASATEVEALRKEVAELREVVMGNQRG